MELLEQLRKNGKVLCAAVYLSVNMNQDETEREVAAQLREIHDFADQYDIIIIESYIERKVSKSEWDRLLDDSDRYRVVLHCGGIGSDIQDLDLRRGKWLLYRIPA